MCQASRQAGRSSPYVYDPDLTEQRLLQEARAQESEALALSERRGEVLVGGLAVLAMAALWLLPVEGDVSVPGAAACALGMLVTLFVRFDVGGGFTVPLQLAFVPLLFAVPAQLVPPIAVAALLAARLPAVARGDSSPGRLTFALGNAWFAIGPAAVLAAVGGPDRVVEEPVLVLAVIGAQFGGDFAASALREVLRRGIGLREQLREAAWVYGVDAALTPVPLWLILGGAHPATVVAVTLTLVALLATFARERAKRLEGMFELNNAYHGTAMLLGDVVEADDSYTGEHCRGVVELALEVGRELDLDATRLRNLEFSALLHDVGKVVIPKEIINKPGPLTPEEFEVVKTHTVEGQRMLDRIGGFMTDVGRIVRSHHERWDGGGYPDGLAGEAIPIEARIVTACDSYSAMTTTRSYRRAMPVEVAAGELEANAGSQFDPAVARALIAIVTRAAPRPAPLAPPEQPALQAA
jgi:putative nucleotidyltransferase with HDIG domain